MDENSSGYEIFERLCAERGLTAYRVSKITGIPTATLSNWKAGRYKPKDDKRRMIADALGVSLSVLDGEVDEEKQSPAEYFYLDEDAAELAQQILENKDLRALFDAAQDVSADDLRKFAAMLKAFKDGEQA